MSSLFTFLMVLGLSLDTFAASEAGKFAKTIANAPQFCQFFREETHKWRVREEKKGDVLKIPGDQIESAVDLIRVCRILTTPNTGELANTFQKALQEDPKTTVSNAYGLASMQCKFQCAELGLALVSTVKDPRSSAKQELIKYLKIAHFPSYLFALNKLQLIESGLENKTWKMNKTQKPAFNKFKTELLNAREAHMSKFDSAPSEDDEKKKEDPKILQIFKDEMLNAKPFMDRIQDIAGQLK